MECAVCGNEHGPYFAQQSGSCPACGSRRFTRLRCPECPEIRFPIDLEESGFAELFRLVLDLDRMKQLHVMLDPNWITYEEWIALSILSEERAEYERERIEQSSQQQNRPLPVLPRTH